MQGGAHAPPLLIIVRTGGVVDSGGNTMQFITVTVMNRTLKRKHQFRTVTRRKQVHNSDCYELVFPPESTVSDMLVD